MAVVLGVNNTQENLRTLVLGAGPSGRQHSGYLRKVAEPTIALLKT